MLTINVVVDERYDESAEEFISADSYELKLEHSLVALSKWESKYEKPFLSDKDKSDDEVLDYVLMMIVEGKNSPAVLLDLSQQNLEDINAYLESKQSATWFSDRNNKPSREVITAELIYYWMVAHEIPFECQYWHLNRLLTLVKICNVKNEEANGNKPKKTSAEIIAERRQLLEERRAQYKKT